MEEVQLGKGPDLKHLMFELSVIDEVIINIILAKNEYFFQYRTEPQSRLHLTRPIVHNNQQPEDPHQS